MTPPGLWSWFLHTSPTERSHTTVCPSCSMGVFGYIAALQEMLAAQPGWQMSPINSVSPPGLLKSGFPESSQPVHLQSSMHGVCPDTVGVLVGTVVVDTGVAVGVVVVVVTVVVDSGVGVVGEVVGVVVTVVVGVVVG